MTDIAHNETVVTGVAPNCMATRRSSTTTTRVMLGLSTWT